jgi:hypothetical protein
VAARETVALTLVEHPLLDTHPLLPVTADGNGNITSTEFVPDEHDVGIVHLTYAYGHRAQATFGDNKANGYCELPGSVTVAPGGTAAYTVTVSINGSAILHHPGDTDHAYRRPAVFDESVTPLTDAANVDSLN